MLAYNPENMTEDEREHLLSTVGQAHADLSEVALKLRLGLPPKTPALKTAIKAERAAFDLKRSLQRLEVKDIETTTRCAPLLPEVRRGGKVVDPESILRHENRPRRTSYRSSPRSSPSKYSSSIRLTAYRSLVRRRRPPPALHDSDRFSDVLELSRSETVPVAILRIFTGRDLIAVAIPQLAEQVVNAAGRKFARVPG